MSTTTISQPVTAVTSATSGTSLSSVPSVPSAATVSVLDRLGAPDHDPEHLASVESAVGAVTEEIGELAALADRARSAQPPDLALAAECGRLAESLASSQRVLRYQDSDTVNEVVRSSRSRLELIRAGDISEL